VKVGELWRKLIRMDDSMEAVIWDDDSWRWRPVEVVELVVDDDGKEKVSLMGMKR
jgi:hypothetical protein